MKIPRWGKIVFTVTLAGFLTITAINRTLSKTPKQIDIQPIHQFKLSKEFTEIEKIAEKHSAEVQSYKWDQRKFIVVQLPHGKPLDDLRDVFRSLNIFQFKTSQDAKREYLGHKATFTEKGCGRLYEERGTDENKYFTAYEPVHFDYNHGIPCGIITSPDITAVFLKNNMLIVVSYSGYSNYENYVHDMNEDIRYTAKMLDENIKAPQPGAAIDR